MNTNRIYIYLSLAGLVLCLGILACSSITISAPWAGAPTPIALSPSNLDLTMTAVFSSFLGTAQATLPGQATQGAAATATLLPTDTATLLPTYTMQPTYTFPPPTPVVVYVPVTVAPYIIIPITVIPVTYVVPTAVATTAVPVPGPTARPGTSVTASFRAAAPVINGDLSDWAGASYPVTNVVFGIANWTGAADLSATIMYGWDNANLYLAATVADNSYQQLATGAYIYKGDSIEILMDTNVSADFYTTGLSADDYQIGMTPGAKPGLIPAAYIWYPTSRTGSAPWVAVAADLTATGYNIEAAIPWAQLGITPVAGQHYGFTFSVSDNDTPATTNQETMVSNVATRHLTNPTTWGDMTLGP